jgi:hypothetical protein
MRWAVPTVTTFRQSILVAMQNNRTRSGAPAPSDHLRGRRPSHALGGAARPRQAMQMIDARVLPVLLL